MQKARLRLSRAARKDSQETEKLVKKKTKTPENKQINYVFAQHNSFCPRSMPVKYGFEIRSLIENNHLPSWRFSSEDPNQIVYKSKIGSNLSKTLISSDIRPRATSTYKKYPCPPMSFIKQRWMISLLNSGQSKEQHRQLSPVVHQSSPTVLENPSLNQLTPRAKLNRRSRCSTFEEHLRRYYQPKWCLTSTREDIQRDLSKRKSSLE